MELTTTNNFVYNEKILDAIAIGLKNNTYLHVHEGAIRSSKTVTAIQELFEAVQSSDKILHAIVAQDMDAIMDNILKSDGFGLLEMYPEYCDLVKDKIGGNYVSVKCDLCGKPKEKKILLASYADKSKWKKILGKTLGVILIDEVNNANKQFIDECFARMASVDSPLMIWTLNGDQPQHYIYQDYINRCKIIGKAPLSIQMEMNQVPNEPGWYLQHWTMKDNPIMTKEKIERASRMYPIGSYYYTCKILGERGSWGELIYNDYMTKEKHIKDFSSKDYKGLFNKYIVGIDIGATKAQNSVSLVGFSRNYEYVGIENKLTFQQCGYDKKKEIILATVLRWKEQGKYIECISVDSAEQNFIIDLNAMFRRYGIEVIPSYKATIKDRVDLGIALLAMGRLLFNNTNEGIDSYNAFLIAKWAENAKGKEREDNNERHNDIIDSIEYALTVHMKALLSVVKKEKKVDKWEGSRITSQRRDWTN
ncbi:MAG: terminase large subunit [Podoviridae sp. ctcf755]|nr:MAG: terminase large subunit [Podoviridae sp. ctcf755]